MVSATGVRRPSVRLLGRVTVLGFVGLAGAVCTDSRSGTAGTDQPAEVDSSYVETGDIDALRRRGRIRFAATVPEPRELPLLRVGVPDDSILAKELADRIGVAAAFATVPDDGAAVTALVSGATDVIVRRRNPEAEVLDEGVAHSIPFRSEPGVFVARAGAAPDSLEDLAGRRIAVARNGAFVGSVDRLASIVPDAEFDSVDVGTAEDAVRLVLDGREDLVLTQRWIADAIVDQHPELESGGSFERVEYVATVRESNPDLLRAINDFLFQVLPAGEDGGELFADLDSLKERKTLRVLTVNGPSTYFVHRGDLVGFDYELLRYFADEQDVLLQMVVVPSVEELVPWLRRGLGDMIGAGVVPAGLADTTGVSFTRPYHDVHPVVVARRSLGLRQIDSLPGVTGIVARNNPFLPLLEAEQAARGFDLIVTSDAESVSHLFDRVESGEADATLVESHLAELELAHRDTAELEIAVRLDTIPGRSWAVRDDQPELLAALDDFARRQKGSLTYNVLLRKYFRPDARVVVQPDLRDDGSLSPFDTIVRQHADGAELDWRLVTAQMFVESRFDPDARSSVGAYGLMQMMPAAAQQVGVRNMQDPVEQIRGGVAYLQWLEGRFPDHLDIVDRRAFTLAAYNAGFGHVSDARHVARDMGLDPDRWVGNVELAMLALSDPDVYRTTVHGYTRGHEPVQYVRRISELGQMYVRLRPN